MKNINSLSLKMIEALDKLVSSTKDEDGKIQFASRDLHLSDRDAAHHVTHVLSDEALAVGMIIDWYPHLPVSKIRIMDFVLSDSIKGKDTSDAYALLLRNLVTDVRNEYPHAIIEIVEPELEAVLAACDLRRAGFGGSAWLHDYAGGPLPSVEALRKFPSVGIQFNDTSLMIAHDFHICAKLIASDVADVARNQLAAEKNPVLYRNSLLGFATTNSNYFDLDDSCFPIPAQLPAWPAITATTTAAYRDGPLDMVVACAVRSIGGVPAKVVNNAVREEFARLSHVYAEIKGLSVQLELMES